MDVIHILAVIVLYRMPPERSPSYSTLLQAAAVADCKVSILLYDNSPAPQNVALPGVQYVHDSSNGGIAAAGNYAAAMATLDGCRWLLMLDQDTSLPEDFFVKFLNVLPTLESRTEIAAVVPAIVSGGRALSPYTYVAGAWPRMVPPRFTGVPRGAVFAFNSGALLRPEAVLAIGGYSPAFWLDASDHHIFRQLHIHGRKVFVLGTVVLGHDLSHISETPLSPQRLSNGLAAESAFWDLEMSAAAGFAYTLVLVRNLAGMWRRGDDIELCRLVRASIVDRLVHTRRHRALRWQRSLAAADADITSGSV